MRFLSMFFSAMQMATKFERADYRARPEDSADLIDELCPAAAPRRSESPAREQRAPTGSGFPHAA